MTDPSCRVIPIDAGAAAVTLVAKLRVSPMARA